MKKLSVFGLALMSLSLLTSCEAVGTIFEAGVWVGIVLVGAVVALVIWLFSRNRNS